MKQLLVLLVFTLGKEYRVWHRVLCVVVLVETVATCFRRHQRSVDDTPVGGQHTPEATGHQVED